MDSVSLSSKKKFEIGGKNDLVMFLPWILNHITKAYPSLKQEFYGSCRVSSLSPKKKEAGFDMTEMEKGFCMLTLDLPPMPVFKDKSEKLVIPTVPLYTLLQKFDGQFKEVKGSEVRRKIEITTLPTYLILKMNRFTKNEFFAEKNRTIVEFPLNGLNLTDYVPDAPKYNLVSCITHQGHYGVTVRSLAEQDKWYQISGDSLQVTEVLPESVAIS